MHGTPQFVSWWSLPRRAASASKIPHATAPSSHWRSCCCEYSVPTDSRDCVESDLYKECTACLGEGIAPSARRFRSEDLRLDKRQLCAIHDLPAAYHSNNATDTTGDSSCPEQSAAGAVSSRTSPLDSTHIPRAREEGYLYLPIAAHKCYTP